MYIYIYIFIIPILYLFVELSRMCYYLQFSFFTIMKIKKIINKLIKSNSHI